MFRLFFLCTALILGAFFFYPDNQTVVSHGSRPQDLDRGTTQNSSVKKERSLNKRGLTKKITILIDPSLSASQNAPSKYSNVTSNYRILTEINLTDKDQKYIIIFKQPLTHSLSLLFIGSEGKVKIDHAQIYFADTASSSATGLNHQYFTGDWYRFEESAKPISGLSFEGLSLSKTGKITLYIQEPFKEIAHE